jgi:DNA-directed RNA polymerase subunit RPC12/RpoP
LFCGKCSSELSDDQHQIFCSTCQSQIFFRDTPKVTSFTLDIDLICFNCVSRRTFKFKNYKGNYCVCSFCSHNIEDLSLQWYYFLGGWYFDGCCPQHYPLDISQSHIHHQLNDSIINLNSPSEID